MNLNPELQVVLGVSIGTVSYIIFHLGKGIQKYAIEGFKDTPTAKKKNSAIWIFGTVMTTLHMFIQWAALLYAPINLIAPLEGIGLIALLIFSYYVLNEEITRRELCGVALIILGIALIVGFQAGSTVLAFIPGGSLKLLFILASIILAVEIAAIFISSRFAWRFAGIIIGTTAGTFMALQTMAKRLTALPELRLSFGVATIVLAILTLAVTQFAFVKARANQVVPCFSSASILLATLLGYLVLHEPLAAPQLFGFAAAISGIILMTASRDYGKTGHS